MTRLMILSGLMFIAPAVDGALGRPTAGLDGYLAAERDLCLRPCYAVGLRLLRAICR
jgi:hypothetical protein